MTHKPIFLKNLSLSFPGRCCFENFTCQIPFGSRIAVIGRNGSGKSSLLKVLQGDRGHATGQVLLPEEVRTGYVQQTIGEHKQLSGGQRLNKQLTEALAKDPNLLLLDEPTNHLDLQNRKRRSRKERQKVGPREESKSSGESGRLS